MNDMPKTIQQQRTVFSVDIPDSFPVTTDTRSLLLSSTSITVLVARTREGKTLLSLYGAMACKSKYPQTPVILITANMTSNVDDCHSKVNNFDEYQDLEIDLVGLDKKENLLKDLVLPDYESNCVHIINADHRHISVLQEYMQMCTKNVIIILDEAHKGGPATYDLIHNHISPLPTVTVLETTATYRTRILRKHDKTIVKLQTKLGYTSPLAATLIDVPEEVNDWCLKNKTLHDIHLDEIVKETGRRECLIGINGMADTLFHKNGVSRIREALEDIEHPDAVAMILITGSKAEVTTLSDHHTTTVKDDNGRALRDPSSIIRAVWEMGYRKIIVLGHKQMEMGATIGFRDMSMTLQIVHVARSKSQADSIVQTIRTGGIGIKYTQRIMMPRKKWEDVIKYVEETEKLSDLLQDCETPEEEADVIAGSYLELDTMHVKNGDYDVLPEQEDTTTWPVHTDCDVFPAEPWMYKWVEMDEHYKRTHKAENELKKWIEECVPNPRKGSRRTIGGSIDTPKARGGNDFQVYLAANPFTNESFWRRTQYWWIHEGNLYVRTVKKEATEMTKGLAHNHEGKLTNFVRPSGRILG